MKTNRFSPSLFIFYSRIPNVFFMIIPFPMLQYIFLFSWRSFPFHFHTINPIFTSIFPLHHIIAYCVLFALYEMNKTEPIAYLNES